VSVCPFVPYTRDLAAFDAVVHHGGAGITYAAILHGKPSLVVPHDYDQFDFAARIEHHGLGGAAAGGSRRGRSVKSSPGGLAQVARDAGGGTALSTAEAFMETVEAAAAERA
jgi:hypothetical protein